MMTDESLPYSLPIGTTREWHGCMLTLTEDGWRAEVKHSMHRRCRGWNYCKPWTYMVTVDTQHHDVPPMPLVDGYQLPQWLGALYARNGHPHLFGELKEELNEHGAAEIALNEFGKAVDDCIMQIPLRYPQVSIIDRVVMPNHVHIIIRVNEWLPEKKPLGEIIKGFKTGVGHCFRELLLGVAKSTPVDVKCSQTMSEKTVRNRQKHGGRGPSNPDRGLVFESGFHDRILFREGQLECLIEYVRSNPMRLWQVVHNRRFFEKMEGWRITMPLLPDGGTRNAGRWWNYYPGGTQALMAEGGAKGLLEKVEIDFRNGQGGELDVRQGRGLGGQNVRQHESKDGSPGGGMTMAMTFNAIGNRELLAVPEKMQIQCSRRMTQEDIDCLISDVLEACEHGVVIVSPCISPGEKQVARAVMDAGYQLIVIFPNGIPPQTPEYKPYGGYFEACAKGQLLILSPWEFYAGKEKLSRWQCLMLNDIAAQLSLM